MGSPVTAALNGWKLGTMAYTGGSHRNEVVDTHQVSTPASEGRMKSEDETQGPQEEAPAEPEPWHVPEGRGRDPVDGAAGTQGRARERPVRTEHARGLPSRQVPGGRARARCVL